MTKAYNLLHAEAHRLCKLSVTDRNYCIMFTFLCGSLSQFPAAVSEASEVVKKQAGRGGGVDNKVLTNYGFTDELIHRNMQQPFISCKISISHEKGLLVPWFFSYSEFRIRENSILGTALTD